MFQTTIRMIFGYAIASATAAAVLITELPIVAGGSMLSIQDYLAATAIIGVFAWAGFPFAIRAHIIGWTRATTFALGGLFAMLVGVSTLMALGALQSLIQGYGDWSVAQIASFVQNLVQLVLLGLLPGLAGGLTYWLVAVGRPVKIGGST